MFARAACGVSVAVWRLPIGNDFLPHIYCLFLKWTGNRLVELMKSGDAGVFSLYYSLNVLTLAVPRHQKGYRAGLWNFSVEHLMR